MFERPLKIGTRTSPLALRQVEEVISLLRAPDVGAGLPRPYIRFEIIGIDTYGDKDKATPISDMEGSDFFTREIEEALLRDEVDFAVHSAKDLPDVIPEGLCVAAMTESIDPYDALVSRCRGGVTPPLLDELPPGARIGASSRRRKEQLKRYREDFQIVDIRGTIDQRLRLLRSRSELDAVIVAACALVRLGLQDRIVQRIPFEILAPHPLQGALAIEVAEENREVLDFIRRIEWKA